MEAIQPVGGPITKVLSERRNPLLNGPTIPDGWSVTSEDSLTPRLLSFKSNSSTESYSEGSGIVLSRSNRQIYAPNAENNYMEYLDMMKLEVDAQLDKLKGDVTGLENYALPDNVYIVGTHLGMSLDVMLIEIDERFNALKLLLAVVFRQAREMLDLTNPSVTDLQWEHELQLEIISITIGECITGLQEELERKLYQQISVTNTMSRNWQEAVAHFAAMREDLGALSKLLFPSVPESHISHIKHESSGSRSSKWKYNIFGKKTKDDNGSSRSEESKSLRKQKSMVISEKSDFRHLNTLSKEETISYFKSEISKLKRVHELALLEKTEELFKLKREKGSLALQNDVEFEPLRKKIPQIIARMDQIISKNIKAPSQYTTHNELDEKCRLTSRIDSLYYDNQHLRGLLADNMKDVKELSSQLSEASRDMSHQLSSEEELLRQINKCKEEWEDLRIECDVRDGLYHTVTRSLLDDYMNDMHDAALTFDAKLYSLEAVISEKESTLCLSYEENQKLRQKVAELEKEMSLQLSSEEELLRQIEKSKEQWEDLRIEGDVRDGLYRTVTGSLLADSMNDMHDAALNFDAKLSSFEAVISENENALCLSYEENQKLKENVAELEKEMSLQLSSEEELLRQIEKSKEQWEDLRIEGDVRDGLYRTVAGSLLDDSMNDMHDAALSFDEKLSSFEAVISEKENALCLSYEENQKLKEKLAELEKVMSLQLSSEEELLRQIEKSKEECEDLRIEGDVRDGLYCTVTRNLLDDSMNDMRDAALSFDAKLSSVISENENALCLSYEENRKLKEKLAELEKESLFQEHQEDPEVIKQESAEVIPRDIEVEPQTSPGRSHETPEQDLQYDELIKLNSSNMDYDGALTKYGQEEQLECILVSIMKLSKEFVEIEQKMSTERTENRSEDLSDHCSHMVKQAVVLTKVGLWYKQMLEARRSELQKAEAKVVILGNKVNAHLSLLERIYVTLDHYSPTLQKYPGLLDAFLKTCKLVAGLRSRHDEDETA